MKLPPCFFLLGGRGTRLFPLTQYIHKSMIPVGGIPILEHILLYIKKQGVSTMIFCISDLPVHKQLMQYFGDGSKYGVKIHYSIGSEDLNTAGRILHAKSLISGPFIVYYGDILTNLNLRQVYEFHRQKQGIGTIVFSSKLPTVSGIGVLNDDLLVKEVKEKPFLPYPTNIGIYILEPQILPYIRKDHDFFQHTLPLAIQNKERLYGFLTECYWLDIGTFRNLDKAEAFITHNFH